MQSNYVSVIVYESEKGSYLLTKDQAEITINYMYTKLSRLNICTTTDREICSILSYKLQTTGWPHVQGATH